MQSLNGIISCNFCFGTGEDIRRADKDRATVCDAKRKALEKAGKAPPVDSDEEPADEDTLEGAVDDALAREIDPAASHTSHAVQMSSGGLEQIRPDPLAVGATRPAVIKALSIPFWFILPIVGLPMLLVMVTFNPFWLVAIAPLTYLGRWLVDDDHNRPRVLLLSFLSGGMFADKRAWQGDSVDPLDSGVRHGY